jgi:hypothetical protein
LVAKVVEPETPVPEIEHEESAPVAESKGEERKLPQKETLLKKRLSVLNLKFQKMKKRLKKDEANDQARKKQTKRNTKKSSRIIILLK